MRSTYRESTIDGAGVYPSIAALFRAARDVPVDPRDTEKEKRWERRWVLRRAVPPSVWTGNVSIWTDSSVGSPGARKSSEREKDMSSKYRFSYGEVK